MTRPLTRNCLSKHNSGHSRGQVPSIYGNLALLYLSNKTVTHHYVKNLQHAYSHPLLRAHISTRNQWPETVLSTMIDWQSLGAACNKHHKQRHFLVKLSHNILPTHRITAQYDKSSPTACPFCLSLPKTRDHLVRCNHAQCHTWRRHLLLTLHKRCESLHTNPVLPDILIQGLDSWLHYQPAPRP